MSKMLTIMAVALAASLSAGVVAQNASSAQEPPAAVTPATPVTPGLSDLEAFTPSCSMAALNAAARRAANVPSQGKYQFTYFNRISDSHHAQYEVHFTSNYEGESDLKYCVELYCQQGWDPKTVNATITLMSNASRRPGAQSHQSTCGTRIAHP